ncbi:hypothetical protein R1A27_22220 [Methylobacterium sp. NMS12]|uniref:hypothetical protein n=1 Tax=Methylobacterium sp. NMS12 TaxID=3079766 RepID=UPI003F885D25
MCADAGKDNAFTDDEAFLFCLGFKAVAVPARDAVLALVDAAAAAEKATVALNGATAALDRLTRLAAASPASHVLAVAPAPARRPLRPEDFGCLPGPPR